MPVCMIYTSHSRVTQVRILKNGLRNGLLVSEERTNFCIRCENKEKRAEYSKSNASFAYKFVIRPSKSQCAQSLVRNPELCSLL